MITPKEEYESLLYLIQTSMPPAPLKAVRLPSSEPVYAVNLDTRTIETPEYLSVKSDHVAETIWFKCPRYFDQYDLTNSVCIVEFINANKESKLYVVTNYYLDENDTDKQTIYIPWLIEGAATVAAGSIQYALMFYRCTEDGANWSSNNNKILYRLNTLPSTSKILNGISGDAIKEFENPEYASEFEKIISRITELEKYLKDEYVLYWGELYDSATITYSGSLATNPIT